MSASDYLSLPLIDVVDVRLLPALICAYVCTLIDTHDMSHTLPKIETHRGPRGFAVKSSGWGGLSTRIIEMGVV